MKNIWAIILAAGESKRMRFPKMLLPYKGSTIIETVIENVLNSQVDVTVVVLGEFGDEIRKVIGNRPVRYCFNELYAEGMLSSVKCGFRVLPHDLEAILVFPGDQPLLKPVITDNVISYFRATGKGIVVPVYEKKRGHPLLISGRYRDDVLSLDPDEGLRSLAVKFPLDVLEIEADTSDILKDIDSQEDYLDELKR